MLTCIREQFLRCSLSRCFAFFLMITISSCYSPQESQRPNNVDAVKNGPAPYYYPQAPQYSNQGYVAQPPYQQQYQQAYPPQQIPYQQYQVPYQQPGSRFYSNPYAIPPAQYYQNYDSDQYYVPPTYSNAVEPQQDHNGEAAARKSVTPY